MASSLSATGATTSSSSADFATAVFAHTFQQRWSAEFPSVHLNRSVVYLDTAGKSALPKSVEEIGIEALRRKSSPWEGLRGDESDVSQLRSLTASLLNCSADDIAIAPSTAFAITMIAENVRRSGRLSPGKKVLLMDKEMGSAVYAWQKVCAETGCSLQVLSRPDYAQMTWTQWIINSIQDDIAVMQLPHAHWCDGAYLDLQQISQYLAARFPSEESRPLLIVDATQSLGAIPLSTTDIDADVVVASVHKWLLSPYGMSLVYVHPRHHHSWLPLDQHERARLGSNQPAWDEEIFMSSTGFPEEFYQGARRLDMGGRPNAIVVPMVVQALQLVHAMNPANVHRYTSYLTDMIENNLLPAIDYVTIVPKSARAGHIAGIRLTQRALDAGITLQRVVEALEVLQIHVSIRGNVMRVSSYVYTTPAMVNKFTSCLLQTISSAITSTAASLPVQKKRVLLTGATGWLAQFAFQQLLATSFQSFGGLLEVYGSYSQDNNIPHWFERHHLVKMELSNAASITAAIESIQPDVVLHFAAISSPVKCHNDRSMAMAVNCPLTFIETIKNVNPKCLFIFASTDMVYDGEHAPYQHEVNTASGSQHLPINVYGESKLAFEQAVTTLENGYVLRLSNMIGKPFVYQAAGEKFLQFLYNCLQQRKFIGLKDDEIRSFVYVEDVLLVVKSLILRYYSADEEGKSWSSTKSSDKVLNIGGPQGISRLTLANTLTTALRMKLNVLQGEQQPICSDEGQNTWSVYKMVSLPNTGNPSALQNPRDITMDVSYTEHAINMKFKSIEDYVESCLYV